MLPLSPLLLQVVISLVIQANLMPTFASKKVRQNPCESLREVVYVDVLSIVRDKMSRGDEGLPAFLMALRAVRYLPVPLSQSHRPRA